MGHPPRLRPKDFHIFPGQEHLETYRSHKIFEKNELFLWAMCRNGHCPKLRLCKEKEMGGFFQLISLSRPCPYSLFRSFFVEREISVSLPD